MTPQDELTVNLNAFRYYLNFLNEAGGNKDDY